MKILALGVLAIVLGAGVAHAQARNVVVNGVRLTDGQVASLHSSTA